MLKKTLLTSLLLAAAASSWADSYYLVTPVRGKTVAASSIQVTISAGRLPDAQVGQPYTYDFRGHLQVAGDAAYSGYGVTWAVAEGALPAGLALDSKTGVVSGTPSAGGSSTFTLTATYKTKAGQQSYQLGVVQIQVALANGAPPAGTVGQAYSYDLRPLLTVQGDAAYDPANVQWTAGGVLPAGLSLAAGVVSGTPSAVGAKDVVVTARYKSVDASRSFSFMMQPAKNIALGNGYRSWADGTYATSCSGYRTPADGHIYSGATGDGTYRIVPPGAAAVDVYCDMTTDGGGWTLVRRIAANSGAWAPVTDNAMGTAPAYGTYVPDPNAASSFSMYYANMPFTDFRFATGDGVKWVIMAKSVLAQATGSCTIGVPVKASHVSASPYSVAMCMRYGSATPEDPWVSADNHNAGGTTASADNDTYSMLYGENSVNLWPTWRTKRGGANVFVR